MRALKALIIDDEASARENIEILLNQFCPQVEVLKSCSNLLDGVQFLKHHKADLVFLDVDMPNFAGYEIGKFIDPIHFEIVFITAYDKYAIKAFELAAVDYLLKPVEIQRLVEAVKRAEERLDLQDKSRRYQVLSQQLNRDSKISISVMDRGSRRFIGAEEIIAIEADGAYSTIHTKRESFTISKNIAKLEQELETYKSGFRSHKSWWVNLDYVIELRNSSYQLVLQNDLLARISRYRMSDLKARFK